MAGISRTAAARCNLTLNGNRTMSEEGRRTSWKNKTGKEESRHLGGLVTVYGKNQRTKYTDFKQWYLKKMTCVVAFSLADLKTKQTS